MVEVALSGGSIITGYCDCGHSIKRIIAIRQWITAITCRI